MFVRLKGAGGGRRASITVEAFAGSTGAITAMTIKGSILKKSLILVRQIMDDCMTNGERLCFILLGPVPDEPAPLDQEDKVNHGTCLIDEG